jgi:hypothetical protein
VKILLRVLGTAASAALLSCASTDVTLPSGPINLTGTYFGTQDGIDAGIAFQEDIIQMAIIQEGDSLSGQWEALFGGIGTLSAEITPSDSILEFNFELLQADPCEGLYAGVAEARVGVRGTGETTVGISGSYTGSDCDGAVEADFIIVRN